MSLIDLLFKQQLILISLGLVLLPLGIAIGMVMIKVLRAVIAQQKAAAVKRRQQKAARAAKAKAQAKARAKRNRAEAMVDELMGDEFDEVDDDDLPVEEVVVKRVSAEAPLPVTKNAPIKTVSAEGEAEATEANGDNAQSDSGDNSENAMQSILDDVFVDDEASERYEVLLSETENINATDLAAFANRIAQQLEERLAS